MHSVVIYYKDANGNLQHYSLCFISDDNTHHTSFFTRFRHYWWNSWRRGFWTAQRSITFQMVVVGNIKISRTSLIYVPIKRTFPSKQSGFSLQVATGNQCVMELVVGWNVMLQNKVCRDHSTTILHAVLEVCQEEMKSFVFLALTKKTWSRWERRWRRGLKMVRRYLVQKAVLTSCPSQLHKLDKNCSEDESFVNIHDFKIPTWGDIGNIAPLYYISCVYNWLWWAGLVKKVDEEQGDVDVQFMQPPMDHRKHWIGHKVVIAAMSLLKTLPSLYRHQLLHFWMKESSNCVEHTEKENFHFLIVPHTFLRLGCPTPKFRQTCTVSQKQLIFRGFKCDIWIPCAKNLACTNVQGSS